MIDQNTSHTDMSVVSDTTMRRMKYQYCEHCQEKTLRRKLQGLNHTACSKCYVGSAPCEDEAPLIRNVGIKQLSNLSVERKRNRPTAFYKKQ